MVMKTTSTPESPLINLRSRFQSPVKRGLYKIAGPLVEKSLAIREFNHRYQTAATKFNGEGAASGISDWFGACLDSFGLKYEIPETMLERIPTTGPLVIVANHPFGFADAVILGHLIGKVRPDAKFLANSMLLKIPEVQPWIIPVDNFKGAGSERRNLGPMKKAIRHLSAGGALIVFPAGEVAHFQMGHGVEECPWNSHIGALVNISGSTVLPVHFSGRNSLLFQAAGLLHPRARTSLLLRELCSRKRRNRPIPVRVGEALPFSKLKRFDDPAELTSHLRLLTLALGHQSTASPTAHAPHQPMSREPDMEMAGEIARLRANGKLMTEQGSLSVYMAEAGEIPLCLQEIGRLREVTFRAVGEGTGKEIDLDAFDEHYLHLILWDEAAARIAGAYRVGRADRLMEAHGSKGLYTHTLFRFSRRFLKKMDSALELGRSFICQEYQRHPASLMLLWKGMMTWVRRHPKYKYLFGPVSISDDYDDNSRRLIVDFLTSQRQPAELRAMAKARSPFRSRLASRLHREITQHPINDTEGLSSLISAIEQDRKGLPILLKHYLKLNASLLCFNVDRDFSSVVDGLILVDLTRTDPRVIARYMGDDGMRAYLDHHGIWPQVEPEQPASPPAI